MQLSFCKRHSFVRAIACLLFALMMTDPCNAQSVGDEPNAKMGLLRAELASKQAVLADLKAQLDKNMGMTKSLQLEKNKLEEKRQLLLQEQIRLGVSDAAYPDIVKSLQEQIVQLTIDLAGLQARRDLLIAARDETQKQTDDEFLEPLKEILRLEQEGFKIATQMHEAGSYPISSMQDAERRLLMAKVRLAEAKRASAGSTNLQDNLLETSLQRAEKQARLDQSKSILDTLTDSRGTFESVAMVESQLTALSSQQKNQRDILEANDMHYKRIQAQVEQLQRDIEAADFRDQ